MLQRQSSAFRQACVKPQCVLSFCGVMRVEIRRLQRQLATTAVYVTHHQLEAMTMADRLVVMNVGRLEQAGSPMEVYARPASLFVAAFTGAPGMNLIPAGELAASGADLSFLPAGTAMVGVRPEDIHRQPVEDDLRLETRLAAAEPAGPETLLHLRILPAGKDLAPRLPGPRPAEPGRAMTVGQPPARLHGFDIHSPRIATIRAMQAAMA